MEQWINQNRTWGLTNAYGSLYQGTHGWTYPIKFISIPDIVVCAKAQYDTGASWGTVYSFSETIATFRAFDVVARAAANKMRLVAYASGRWK
ncbi:hypothetical protein CE91St62_16300 [Lachnospiraceae bacterium]|nr:hypothetical protein CE91St62_16300 [Lachnospiraceae bacterium]